MEIALTETTGTPRPVFEVHDGTPFVHLTTRWGTSLRTFTADAPVDTPSLDLMAALPEDALPCVLAIQTPSRFEVFCCWLKGQEIHFQRRTNPVPLNR